MADRSGSHGALSDRRRHELSERYSPKEIPRAARVRDKRTELVFANRGSDRLRRRELWRFFGARSGGRHASRGQGRRRHQEARHASRGVGQVGRPPCRGTGITGPVMVGNYGSRIVQLQRAGDQVTSGRASNSEKGIRTKIMIGRHPRAIGNASAARARQVQVKGEGRRCGSTNAGVAGAAMPAAGADAEL